MRKGVGNKINEGSLFFSPMCAGTKKQVQPTSVIQPARHPIKANFELEIQEVKTVADGHTKPAEISDRHIMPFRSPVWAVFMYM